MDREAALKVLHEPVEEGAGDASARRFRNEAKLLAQIVHPNILPLYEADQDGGQFYLVTALVRGQTLDRLVPPEGLPDPRRAAVLVAPLLEALHYAHTTHGICHRDIKPANVMVAEGDNIFLMDFGLAVSQNLEGSRITAAGTPLGTPSYMPPEQAEGKLADVGPWSDQYSAGVVLFHLLTGRTPFRKPWPLILSEIVAAPPPPPSQLRPELDAEIDRIVLQALAKDPRERFRDCREFANALRDWSSRAGSAASGGKSDRRPSSWVVGGVLLAVVLATLVGYLLFSNKSTNTPTSRHGERSKWQE
jgi:serine/threonine-protein kinase